MSKLKKLNWFQQQDQKKAANKQGAPKDKTTYKEVTAPILKVFESSKKEEDHFEAALAFALKVSDPTSTDLQTVHLTMDDTLVFNMVQDDHYKKLWTSKHLLLLIAFPKNWQTMPLTLEDDEDDDDIDLSDPYDRFDYLYESGMQVCE